MYAQQALMKLLHQRRVGRVLTRANHMEPVECMMEYKTVLMVIDDDVQSPTFISFCCPPFVSLSVCLSAFLFADRASRTISMFCLVISAYFQVKEIELN